MSRDWSEKNFAVTAQNWDAGQETFSATNAMGTGPFKITLRENQIQKQCLKEINTGGVI